MPKYICSIRRICTTCAQAAFGAPVYVTVLKSCGQLQIFALNDHVIIFMRAQQEMHVSLLGLFQNNGLSMKLRSLVSTFDVCCQNSCALRPTVYRMYKEIQAWLNILGCKVLLIGVTIQQIFESFNGVRQHFWHGLTRLIFTLYTKSAPDCKDF